MPVSYQLGILAAMGSIGPGEIVILVMIVGVPIAVTIGVVVLVLALRKRG